MKSLQSLRTLLQKLPARLEALPPDSAEVKPADSWSVKEELGHLLDSAANNHQRIVRAQLEDNPAMPGYDGPAWVVLHAYQKRDWHELIGTWGRSIGSCWQPPKRRRIQHGCGPARLAARSR